MEEFKGTKHIKGYDGLYSIHKDGYVISHRIWNGLKNRRLTAFENSFGYLTVQLTNRNGKSKKHFIHKLVASHFIGEKPKNLQIRHLDWNKLNNKSSNLKYGTAKENAADRLAHGTNASGSKIGTSKLSENDVLEIRKSYKKRGDMVKLASKYNVSCANIYMIINKISRKNG